MSKKYVHGYTERESVRLADQASTLTQILHWDTIYPAGSLVLEPGCGVGAQTVILAKNSPGAKFISVDKSEESLCIARTRFSSEKLANVEARHCDIFDLPYPPDSFDHVFVCFLLEHLSNPGDALACLRRVLKPGGTITVIEGDHGSTFFSPESTCARHAIQCLIEIQSDMGGNSLIGRQLYPLVSRAKFRDVRVSPRLVYVDASRPELVEGFTRNTFIAMVEGVRTEALRRGLSDEYRWNKGIEELNRTTEADGTFIYVFFKCIGTK